jgi:hypothetical protein
MTSLLTSEVATTGVIATPPAAPPLAWVEIFVISLGRQGHIGGAHDQTCVLQLGLDHVVLLY